MNTRVGGIWRARTSSTVGSQEPISTLPSLRSITLKSRTAHQKAARRSGSWQSTTNSVNLLVMDSPRQRGRGAQPRVSRHPSDDSHGARADADGDVDVAAQHPRTRGASRAPWLRRTAGPARQRWKLTYGLAAEGPSRTD